jgi:hypothetical protein
VPDGYRGAALVSLCSGPGGMGSPLELGDQGTVVVDDPQFSLTPEGPVEARERGGAVVAARVLRTVPPGPSGTCNQLELWVGADPPRNSVVSPELVVREIEPGAPTRPRGPGSPASEQRGPVRRPHPVARCVQPLERARLPGSTRWASS